MFDIQPYAIGMLLLGVPNCEQYPSQPLFPNLWDSNIHWVGLGVNLPETMVVFPMKYGGPVIFPFQSIEISMIRST